MKRNAFLSMMVLSAVAATVAAQPVVGDVVSVGFPAGSWSIVREGQWFPVQVRLTVQGSLIFNGSLRIQAPDLDGDVVHFLEPVTLGGDVPSKRFWCYAAVNRRDEVPEAIDILDDAGRLVAELPTPMQPIGAILNDDLLVLDISTSPVPRLASLQTPAWSPGEFGDPTRVYYRNVVISNVAARDLPDRWIGLEAVDVILWDRPDRSEVSRAQVDALVTWVRHGGQLVVGVGAGWDAIRKMPQLGEILPLTGGDGGPVQLPQMPGFLRQMAFRTAEGGARALPELVGTVEATTAQPKDDALRTFGELVYGMAEPISLITMRLEGSGRVVSTAVDLATLASQRIDPERFFAAVMDLPRYSKEFQTKLQNDAISGMSFLERAKLYEPIATAVGFTTRAALGGLVAFLFVGGYILVATLVSWWWLAARGQTYLSWSVFAGLAVVASVLSLATVGLLRGVFSRGVQSVHVLDVEAGQPEGRGPCLFGYGSPVRQRVDLKVPGRESFVRALSRGPKLKSHFMTPAHYTARPSLGELRDVLMRATLKQVEGVWEGELDGTIRADLVVDRRTGRLTPASWIANELPHKLDGGYLLFIDPRQVDVPPGEGWQSAPVPYRVTNVTEFYDRPPKGPAVPPSYNVLAVPVEALEAGAQAAQLGQSLYRDVDRGTAQWQRAGRPRIERIRDDRDLRTLWNEQLRWARGGWLAGGAGPVRALLLASTRNLFLHNANDNDFDGVGTAITTEGLPDLDVTHWLLRGQAVLLTWAGAPGPARLHRDGDPLSSRGLTFYRVRVPLRYTGSPPAPPPPPGEQP